jgi:hypothetical protein
MGTTTEIASCTERSQRSPLSPPSFFVSVELPNQKEMHGEKLAPRGLRKRELI